MMKKLLVTGGAGFIGSNFIKYILGKYPDYRIVNLDKLTYAGNLDNLTEVEDNPNYRFVKGDICDSGIVEELVKGSDAIINFAAETHVDRSILEAGDFIKTDVYGTFVLLEAARKFGIERMIQISTDEVYGEAEGKPSKEGDDLKPKSPYAASKTGADRLAFSYFTTYSLPVIITRCSNNYGPNQYPEKMIPLFVTNALMDLPLPVYGTGKNRRDWIYVLDHCQALDIILHCQGQEGEVFNVGARKEVSILEMVDIILETLGKPKSLIKMVKDREGHVMRHAVDVERIGKVLGWQAETDFEQGIRSTISWYRENRDWWKKIKEKSESFKEFYKEWYTEKGLTSQ